MFIKEIRQYLHEQNLPIISAKTQQPQEAAFGDVPELCPQLADYLKAALPKGLWSHQAEAVKLALDGKDTVISTATASGKTLAFALPVVQKLLEDDKLRAFFIYPTKALASDQLETLNKICDSLGLHGVVQKFDGDVQGPERKRALRRGRIFLINPDILHATLLRLNNEPEYLEIFRNLRYVVLDECHIYSGAFGSNVAMTMRRLRQVCRRHKIEPVFLAASATTSNPQSQMQGLVGKPFHVVDESGAPTGLKHYLFLNPIAQDYLDAAMDTAARLTRRGKRFIMFCETRKQTELQYINFQQRYPDLAKQVMPYRSGYEAEDRQAIEQAMRNKTLRGVFSTSALELGVDLPDLDVCILAGLPNSKMSFLQRAGRVGRHPNSEGIVLLFPSESFVDQYYLNNPDKYFERPVESCKIHLDNRMLLVSHLACALVESGSWRDPDLAPDIFGEDFCELAKRVDEIDEDIINNPEPHSCFSLRGIDDPTYELFLPERKLGELNHSQLMREAYPEAVYLHQGRRYRVKRIYHHTRQIKIDPERSPVITFPICHASVIDRRNSTFRFKDWEDGKVKLFHTMLNVTTSTDGYRIKIGDNWTNHKYSTPINRRVITEGVWLRFEEKYSRSGLNALAHAVANTYLLTELFEPQDLATHAVVNTKSDGSSRIYFYDTVSGGLGISQGIYDNLLELLKLARHKLLPDGCNHCSDDPEEFDRGCPSCIATNRLFVERAHLSKKEGLAICDALIATLSREPQRSYELDLWKRRQTGRLVSTQPVAEPDEEIEIEEIKPKNLASVFRPGARIILSVANRSFTVKDIDFDENKVFYKATRDDGTEVRLPHSDKLTLEAGERSWLCLGCGTTMDEKIEQCPVCGIELAG